MFTWCSFGLSTDLSSFAQQGGQRRWEDGRQSGLQALERGKYESFVIRYRASKGTRCFIWGDKSRAK